MGWSRKERDLHKELTPRLWKLILVIMPRRKSKWRWRRGRRTWGRRWWWRRRRGRGRRSRSRRYVILGEKTRRVQKWRCLLVSWWLHVIYVPPVRVSGHLQRWWGLQNTTIHCFPEENCFTLALFFWFSWSSQKGFCRKIEGTGCSRLSGEEIKFLLLREFKSMEGWKLLSFFSFTLFLSFFIAMLYLFIYLFFSSLSSFFCVFLFLSPRFCFSSKWDRKGTSNSDKLKNPQKERFC